MRGSQLISTHIIMDNDPTHETALVRAWLARRPHDHSNSTPNLGIVDQLVERWSADLARTQRNRGVHSSTTQIEQDILRIVVGTLAALPFGVVTLPPMGV